MVGTRAVTMKMAIFWDVMPSSLVDRLQYLEAWLSLNFTVLILLQLT
jgi:hypothetical protein